MTAQPSTKQNSADFTATLRNLSNSDDSSHSIRTNDSNSNCFSSEDFQRFLSDHRDAFTSNSSSSSSPSSLDQIFKTSEFFKNQQSFSDLFKSQQSISDLFKSQQSFSQMFQSKDSFAELFKSLDSDQKKAIFSDATTEPLSPPTFPAMESPSRMFSTSSSGGAINNSRLMQSKDWKNLGTHEEINYTPKLFRDTSSSSTSDTNGPLSIQPRSQSQTQSVESAASKTNWGDFFFSQLQSGAASTGPLAAPAPAQVDPPSMVPPPISKPVSQQQNTKVARKSGKRYVSNPAQTDILMGRGGKSNHHPGNKRYREEILNFKKTYSQLTSKEDKTELSRHVVDFVHKYKGRFLALDKTVNRWYEITDAVARRKVSQALREDVDPLKRQQKRARFLERKRQKEQAQQRV